MTGFISGADRTQGTMFPAQLEDYVVEDNPVRVIDFFVDQLDLGELGFWRVQPKLTGRPAYDPAVMLKLYIYGYLNRVQSSRRLERECQPLRGLSQDGSELASIFLRIFLLVLCQLLAGVSRHTVIAYAPHTRGLPESLRSSIWCGIGFFVCLVADERWIAIA